MIGLVRRLVRLVIRQGRRGRDTRGASGGPRPAPTAKAAARKGIRRAARKQL